MNCNGIIVRAHVYFKYTEDLLNSSTRIINQVRLNILKKQSCPGCEHCAKILDYLMLADGTYLIKGIEGIQHGRLYQLTAINEKLTLEEKC